MDRDHFQREMNRLISVYTGGERFYSPERLRLIWREVEHLPNTWMTRTVDHFVGTQRQAPLVPEFREEISKDREREYVSLKSVQKQEAEDFFHSNETVAHFCNGIKDILKGKLDGQDKQSFYRLMNTAKGKKGRWEDVT